MKVSAIAVHLKEDHTGAIVSEVPSGEIILTADWAKRKGPGTISACLLAISRAFDQEQQIDTTAIDLREKP